MLQTGSSGCHSRRCYRLSSSARTRWPHAALPGTHLWWRWCVHSATPMYLQVHIQTLSLIPFRILIGFHEKKRRVSSVRTILIKHQFSLINLLHNISRYHSPFGLNSSVTALIGQPPLAQPCRLSRAWLELMWVKTG